MRDKFNEANTTPGTSIKMLKDEEILLLREGTLVPKEIGAQAAMATSPLAQDHGQEKDGHC